MKYRKKPVVVDATQWFKNGDHPLDYSEDRTGFENDEFRTWSGEEAKALAWEGGVVRYYRSPNQPGRAQGTPARLLDIHPVARGARDVPPVMPPLVWLLRQQHAVGEADRPHRPRVPAEIETRNRQPAGCTGAGRLAHPIARARRLLRRRLRRILEDDAHAPQAACGVRLHGARAGQRYWVGRAKSRVGLPRTGHDPVQQCAMAYHGDGADHRRKPATRERVRVPRADRADEGLRDMRAMLVNAKKCGIHCTLIGETGGI